MNKKAIISVVSFAIGFVAGAAMSIYKEKHPVEVTKGSDITEEESDSDDYADIDEMEDFEPSPNSDASTYQKMADKYQSKTGKEQTVKNKPVIISPDDYGEIEYYDQTEFMYMADDILLNEEQEVVDNYTRLIGDALQHFGEYEEDSVYVRNDRLKLYIAILKDERKSTDLPKRYAH